MSEKNAEYKIQKNGRFFKATLGSSSALTSKKHTKDGG